MQNKRATFISLAAAMLTAGILYLTNQAVAPTQATWNDVLIEAATGGYKIIATEDLAARYRKDPQSLFLVDTRQEWEYRTGHLKGALNFSMEPTWWARWRNASALGAFLGPDKERTIVFY